MFGHNRHDGGDLGGKKSAKPPRLVVYIFEGVSEGWQAKEVMTAALH
jgi:hypothetical protein